MSSLSRHLRLNLGALAMVVPAVLAAAPQLPIIQGQKAVASVAGDPVTLQEFEAELFALHAGREETGKIVPKQDPTELLNRLITSRLIVQEAQRIGLGELPEIKQMLSVFEKDALRGALLRQAVPRDLKPDASAVAQIYRQLAERYRVRAILIDKEAVAQQASQQIKAGQDFDAVAAGLVAQHKIQAGAQEQTAKLNEMQQVVQKALATLKPGEVSAVLPLGGKFTIVKFLELVYPEDAAARQEAEDAVLQRQRKLAVSSYTDKLKRQYARVDDKLLASVDFEAPQPGIEKLLQDKRVLARITGGAPVTVGDVADAMKKKFFHGVEQAITKKKLNAAKAEIVDDVVSRRVVLQEARRLKLDQTPGYKAEVEDQRSSLLFGAFVQKVIDPGIKLDEAEVKQYLKDHAAEYTSPELIRLDFLAFTKREDAEAAVTKLRRGADIAWMRANEGGQASAEAAAGVLGAPGDLIVTSQLPPGARKAVSGARSGDLRFYGETAPPYFAIVVKDLVPAAPQPFDKVKGEAALKVFGEKRTRALEDYAAKLRAATDVKVFATGEQLAQLVRADISAKQ